MQNRLLRHDHVLVELTQNLLEDDGAELRSRLREVMLSGARTIIVDLSAADGLPSTVVAAMLNAHRVCRVRGGQVVICHPSRRALLQLQRTGLWRVFRIEPPVSAQVTSSGVHP